MLLTTDDRSRILEIFEWPYLTNRSSDSLPVCSTVGVSGSLDRMALHPIGPNPRYGGRQPSCIKLKGHISEMVHPIPFVFGSRVKVLKRK